MSNYIIDFFVYIMTNTFLLSMIVFNGMMERGNRILNFNIYNNTATVTHQNVNNNENEVEWHFNSVNNDIVLTDEQILNIVEAIQNNPELNLEQIDDILGRFVPELQQNQENLNINLERATRFMMNPRIRYDVFNEVHPLNNVEDDVRVEANRPINENENPFYFKYVILQQIRNLLKEMKSKGKLIDIYKQTQTNGENKIYIDFEEDRCNDFKIQILQYTRMLNSIMRALGSTSTGKSSVFSNISDYSSIASVNMPIHQNKINEYKKFFKGLEETTIKNQIGQEIDQEILNSYTQHMNLWYLDNKDSLKEKNTYRKFFEGLQETTIINIAQDNPIDQEILNSYTQHMILRFADKENIMPYGSNNPTNNE